MFTNIQSVTYKSISIENDITLPDNPIKSEIPFIFNGKNITESPILVRAVPTCGCTAKLQDEFKVEPGGSFEISGTYTAGDHVGKYSKRVRVYFGEKGTNDHDSMVMVTFRGNTV
jgi:Protein of unknown function (DUF1573)